MESASRNEDALKAMLDTFVQRLQSGTGDRMQDVTQSLAGLSSRLEGLQSGLGDAAVRMARSADAMASRMGEGAEAALSEDHRSDRRVGERATDHRRSNERGGDQTPLAICRSKS